MIIPAILTTNERIAAERVATAQHMSGWIHLDFLDNSLYPFESLPLADFETIDFGGLQIEAHAMTDNPEALLESNLPIERILVHVELTHWQSAYDAIITAGKEAWLVIDAGTDFDAIDFPTDLVGVVMMGVHAGRSGQNFIPETYERIERFKERYPDIAITIDGGVGPDNLRLLLKHGADHFVMGSAIFNQPNPIDVYEKYVKLTDPLGGEQ